MQNEPIGLPQDIQKLITSLNTNSQKRYPLENLPLLSETFPVTAVTFTTIYQKITTEEAYTPKEKGKNLPNPQWYLDDPCSGFIRYSHDKIVNGHKTPDLYLKLTDYWLTNSLLIDGNNNCAVIAQVNEYSTSLDTYIIYTRGIGNQYYNRENIMLKQSLLTALSLDHTKNIIAYSSQQYKTNAASVHIAHICTENNLLHTIFGSFIPYPPNHTLSEITSTRLKSTPFKKIINIGCSSYGRKNNLSDIYLCIDQEGYLYSMWYGIDKQLNIIKQNIKEKKILDIAVDNTYEENGFKRHIVLLDTNKNLFAVYLNNTTDKQYLIPIKLDKPLDTIKRISYDNGKCGIIHHKKQTARYGESKINSNYDQISINQNSIYFATQPALSFEQFLLITDDITNNRSQIPIYIRLFSRIKPIAIKSMPVLLLCWLWYTYRT